jgi:hypothetical protein
VWHAPQARLVEFGSNLPRHFGVVGGVAQYSVQLVRELFVLPNITCDDVFGIAPRHVRIRDGTVGTKLRFESTAQREIQPLAMLVPEGIAALIEPSCLASQECQWESQDFAGSLSLRQPQCSLKTLVLWRERVMQNLDAALAGRGVAASQLVDESFAYLAPRGEE